MRRSNLPTLYRQFIELEFNKVLLQFVYYFLFFCYKQLAPAESGYEMWLKCDLIEGSYSEGGRGRGGYIGI